MAVLIQDRETVTVPIPMSSAQIVDDIVARIASGEYPAGSRLPSQRDLAELYSVGTTTVYRIFEALKRRGLVVGSQGRGMYVAERPPAT